VSLDWRREQDDGGYIWLEAAVPVKGALARAAGRTKVPITIERRPPHCDRGRYVAKCVYNPADGLVLDWAEGWPRYYFDLDRAKAEIAAWVERRLADE
jgi:hypothetical protein